MAEHNQKGKWGEDQAAEFLAKNGYEILERNYTFERAEIDIIAKKGIFLVIVEVKTRTTDQYGSYEELVTPRQQRQIINAAEGYIQTNDLDLETRFDVISIIIDKRPFEIEHIEEAFYPQM